MKRTKVVWLSVGLLSLAAAVAPQGLRAGTVIEVSTTDDDLIVNGNCSLREAVLAANHDAKVDACPAGSGADTILLPAGKFLLSLTGANEDGSLTGDLDLAGAVTIRGAGLARTILNGGSLPEPDSDRVIHVLAGAEAALTGMSVLGGICTNGGAIFNAGKLNVEDVRIVGNIASEAASNCRTQGFGGGGGGIFNAGELVMRSSELWRNEVIGTNRGDVAYPGGGVLNLGLAVLDQVDIKGNYAAGGGGIWSSGELEMADSQIRDNGARFYAAGLENSGQALVRRSAITGNSDGGIVNRSFLVLENSTLSGNHSFRIAGSIHNWGGDVEITNCTVTSNLSSQPGAGIGGTTQKMRMLGTIVANGPDGDCAGPVVSLGHNLDLDGSCGLDGPGDLPQVDPRLGPLAQNDGFSRTHALLPGSPAVDHIPAAECAVDTDQRGVLRPQPSAGACDVGAFEVVANGNASLIVGDLDGMREHVKRLFALREITKQQEIILLDRLKVALLSASRGDDPPVCQALEAFSSALEYWVAESSLSPEQARPLLDAAGRIMSLVCG